MDQAATITEAMEELDGEYLEGSGSSTYRLLALLYSRSGDLLDPYRNWHNEGYYRYPMIDAMFGKTDGPALS